MDLSTPVLITVIIKLVLAIVLGAAIGLERSLAGKTAGMRTYTLVTLGSTLFVTLFSLVNDQFLAQGIRTLDPLHAGSQVILGVGFLGAGLIIFQDQKVLGLTTAAGLWVASGLGLAIGYGFYSIALIVTFLTLFIFTGLWYLEDYLDRHIRAKTK